MNHVINHTIQPNGAWGPLDRVPEDGELLATCHLSTYLVKQATMPFGASHGPLVQLAGSAITSFFRKIEVYGTENVPEEGPIILWVTGLTWLADNSACTHTNMAIDVRSSSGLRLMPACHPLQHCASPALPSLLGEII